MSLLERFRKVVPPPPPQTGWDEFQKVWCQKDAPVLCRLHAGDLLLRVPYRDDNKGWVAQQAGPKARLRWDPMGKRWTLARNNFTKLIDPLVDRYNRLYTVTVYRPHEICAPACMQTRGHDCACQCLGKRHGSGILGPREECAIISDACAIVIGQEHYVIRRLTARASEVVAHGCVHNQQAGC